MDQKYLYKINQITNNIYLSGIYPLEEDYKIIKKLNIKYILTCVDKKYVENIHKNILLDNLDLIILYIPYNDDIKQNLWENNDGNINIVRYIDSIYELNKTQEKVNNYKNKPMIEIAYDFINNAIENNQNILIHCMAGISRSVSAIIYFLMKKYNYNFNYSLYVIQNQRPIANPNYSFKGQLINYGIKKENFNHNYAQYIIDKIL